MYATVGKTPLLWNMWRTPWVFQNCALGARKTCWRLSCLHGSRNLHHGQWQTLRVRTCSRRTARGRWQVLGAATRSGAKDRRGPGGLLSAVWQQRRLVTQSFRRTTSQHVVHLKVRTCYRSVQPRCLESCQVDWPVHPHVDCVGYSLHTVVWHKWLIRQWPDGRLCCCRILRRITGLCNRRKLQLWHQSSMREPA